MFQKYFGQTDGGTDRHSKVNTVQSRLKREICKSRPLWRAVTSKPFEIHTCIGQDRILFEKVQIRLNWKFF